MVYIIATLIKKAIEIKDKIEKDCQTAVLWKHLMLTPIDYHISCIKNELTQSLMRKITFLHGGKEFDDKYPQGIPTCLTVKFKDGNIIDSGLIMFPEGHASCDTGNLEDILKHKF
jgi:2-methylcitrate dehydratase